MAGPSSSHQRPNRRPLRQLEGPALLVADERVWVDAWPGGLFALSSNSGSYGRTAFAVAPEVNLNLGYQVSEHLRLLAGYSFIYLTNVARPGNQIDTTLNTNLFPPAIPGGPARPAFAFHESDFWAQGINLGGEVRW